jgi:hypothetical protein
MKQNLDRARLKVTTLSPDSPQVVRLRVARQLATDCTTDELVALLSEILEQQRIAAAELAHAEVRLMAVMTARGFQHGRS